MTPSKINYGISNLESWNPIVVYSDGKRGWHCSKISLGCQNCWGEQVNKRFGNGLPYDNRKVEFEIDQKVLERPLHWKKPRTIFVCDLCDLFHEDIHRDIIDEVMNTIWTASWEHEFLMLTKRPQEMAIYFEQTPELQLSEQKNLWLGITVCNQAEADEKIPILLSIPAAHRWVSIEPCLSAIDLSGWACGKCLRRFTHSMKMLKIKCPHCEHCDEHTGPIHNPILGKFTTSAQGDNARGLDFVVVGNESGPKHRHSKLSWIQGIINQCKEAQVPVFVKQIEIDGIHKVNLTKDPSEWPESLRVREAPWRL